MKEKSEKDILKFLKQLWAGIGGYGEPDFRVRHETGCYKLDIVRMYEAPGLTFSQLKAIAEFFGTENINDDARFSRGGCETCDYGSEYGFTLTIRPDNRTEEEKKWGHLQSLQKDSN